MITMSCRADNVTEDGLTVAECVGRLKNHGAEIIGVNCMRDQEYMYRIIEEMRAEFYGYMVAQPVAFPCTGETPWFTVSSVFMTTSSRRN